MSEQIQVWLLTRALTREKQREIQHTYKGPDNMKTKEDDGLKHWSDPATSQGMP